VREQEFESLSKQLLERGIAARFATRIGAELKDHYADLERELRAANRCTDEAAAEARSRLGDESVIANEFAVRPELRAWIYRSAYVVRALSALLSIIALVLAPHRVLLAHRNLLGRYLGASSAAIALTGCLLLTMQWALRPPPALEASGPPSLGVRLASGSPESIAVIPADGAGASGQGDAHDSRSGADLLSHEPPPRVARRKVEQPQGARETLAALRPGEISIPPPNFRTADGEFLPIVKVAPIYPPLAATLGLEGYVVVEFTITPVGTVEDAVVVESSNELFHDAALEAAHKFKYKPRIVSGKPVAVSGVRNKITFVLEA